MPVQRHLVASARARAPIRRAQVLRCVPAWQVRSAMGATQCWQIARRCVEVLYGARLSIIIIIIIIIIISREFGIRLESIGKMRRWASAIRPNCPALTNPPNHQCSAIPDVGCAPSEVRERKMSL